MTRAETAVEIHEVFAERRSPRSLDENVSITNQELIALLEAARWAPSAFNHQPWRFLAGQRSDENFDTILALLSEFNQAWAKRSSALILIAGLPKTEDGKENPTYLYDCGLAASQLTLEAHHRGFVAHQMAGFDHEKAAIHCKGAVPIAVIAIGKQAPAEQLEGPAYEREIAPRTRKSLDEIVLKGLPS